MSEYEFLVGTFYYKKSSYGAALGRFLGLIRDFPDYKNNEEVLYLIGRSYKELNEIDLSEKYLNELIEKYPGSDFSKKARKTLSSLKK
jgi:outer membrane protein assembly factor BamD